MLVANTMTNISELIPPFGAAKHGRIREMPIFTRGFDKLDKAALADSGVLGGPCLFGADEMFVEITTDSGEVHLFDFATCNNCNDSTTLSLGDFFIHFAKHIKDVSFQNKKNRLTMQEYETLAYPMEIAHIFDIPIVFPIPDESYKKFLVSVSDNLNPVLREGMLEEFTRQTNKIADMHIELFHELLREYPLKRYSLMHGRDTKTLERFYEKRESYFRSKTRRKKFTSMTGKEESVYDYVSFIAAPFYLWGTRNILQVDIIRETDSMKKCADAHGKEISIFGFMFSGMLSKNGVETNYDAKQQNKIYVGDDRHGLG